MKDLTPREVLVFVPLLVMIFWMGIYSKPFTERMEPSITKFVEQMTSVRQAMIEGSDGRVVTMARSPLRSSRDTYKGVSYRAAEIASSDHRDHPATVVGEERK